MTQSSSVKFRSNLPSLDPLDKRLNAYRPDLADERLEGKVEAEKFVTGNAGRICLPVADLKASPDINVTTEHQLLLGEEVLIFDEAGGFSWVQSKLDNYVGYVASASVEVLSANPINSTHIIAVPTTFCYPRAELRSPPLSGLSIGSRVAVTGSDTVRGTQYAKLASGGWVIEKHLQAIDDYQTDFVSICELMENIPYLWGGASGFGLDCSSLIQLAMRLCGTNILRDSDMQGATLGEVIEPGEGFENLQRGDLIFWRAHVAVHKGTIHRVPHIIHANGHTMDVVVEPLREAIERIGYLYEMPIGFRRPGSKPGSILS